MQSSPASGERTVAVWSAGGGKGDMAKLGHIVEPVVSTLVAGIRAYVGSASIRLLRQQLIAHWIKNATQVTSRGDIFIWVGEAGRTYVPWLELKKKGVYAVYYQTEPWDSGCALSRHQVDEIWDFAWHNIDACQATLRKKDVPTLRWVPLGALPAKHQVGHHARVPALFFLGAGSRKSGKTRYWCLRQLEGKDQLGRKLYKRDNVWTEDEYARLLKRHDVFLNVHKGCGDPHNPVTFRVSKILNAGGLIISERAFPKDEREYEGLVTFVNVTIDNMTHNFNMTAVTNEFWRTAAMSAAERAALAERRQQAFAKRFAPERLFERAGIYDLFTQVLFNGTLPQRHALDDAANIVQRRTLHPPLATGPKRQGGKVACRDSNIIEMGPTNAVLATVDVSGFSPSAFLPFFCSFLAHVPSARLVLFVRPASAISSMIRGGQAPNQPHPRITLRPWPDNLQDKGFSQVFRYRVYADFLASPEGLRFEKVAVSDAADVSFQADPFAHVLPSDDLVFGTDKDLIGHSRGNRYWVKNLYGVPILDRLGALNVSTSGFTMGKRAGFQVYLERMAAEVQRVVVPRLEHMAEENWMLAKGYDQGVHIYLLYEEFLTPPRHGLSVRSLPYDEVYISGASGMRLGRDVLLDGAILRNLRNATIAVVHQWNRMQWDVRDTLGCKKKDRKAEADFCTACRSTWTVVRSINKGLKETLTYNHAQSHSACTL